MRMFLIPITIKMKIKNKNIHIKVCGMKHSDNIQAVATLDPDYMGFIFYEKSPRNFDAIIPKLPDTIKKTGVFVNAPFEFVLEKVARYHFKAIQLHGNEDIAYCTELRSRLDHNTSNTNVELFKVFSIKDHFDFAALAPYEGVVDYFLFDTKGKEKGGNGYTFDWSVLKNYRSTTPIILSGGIGVDEIEKIQEILASDLPIYALDINSKFEDVPGLKNIEKLKLFMGLIEE